ncbi:MAG: hypothetical protein HDR80_08840 [Bacteroides sp.]|nr:hypothetical protein [Bacteroides sp.]
MKPTVFLCFILSALILNARYIVPFDTDSKNNLPIVEVYVNNDTVPFNFVFDTGCSVVMANANNDRLMKQLNLCDTDTAEYAHSSAIIRKTAFDNTLMLGSLLVDSVQIFADNDPSTDYDGIIGQRLLERFSKIGIFPDSKIIIFCEKGESLKIADGIIQPIIKSGGVYGTDLSIKTDSCDVRGIYMIDTGFTGILCVNSDFSESNNLPTILKQFGRESSSDGGGIKNNSIMVTAPRIMFAGESMPLLPILLEENSYQAEWRQTFNGLIGYDILKRFRMIWDYENMTISFAPGFNYFSPLTSIRQQ